MNRTLSGLARLPWLCFLAAPLIATPVVPAPLQDGDAAPASTAPRPDDPTAGQDPGFAVEPELGVAELRERAQAAEALPTEAELRLPLMEAYSAALAATEEALALREESAGYAAAAEAAEARIATIDAELARLAARPSPESRDHEGLGLEQLVAAEARLEAELDVARDTASKLEEGVRQLTLRRSALAPERAALEQRLQELDRSISELDGLEGPAELRDALRARSLAERSRARARLELLRTEETTFDPRLRWRQRQLDLARATQERLEGQWIVLTDTVNRSRIAAAEAAAAAAREALESRLRSSPAFAEIVGVVGRLRSGTVDVARDLERIRVVTRELEQANAALDARFQDLRSRIVNPSLAEATGMRLRQEQRQCATARADAASALERLGGLTAAELEHFKLGAKLAELDAQQGVVEQLARDAAVSGSVAMDDALDFARIAVNEYRDALGTARDTRKAEVAALERLGAVGARFLAAIERTEAFVAERILWIRSADAIWHVQPGALRTEAREALAPAEWRAVARGVLVGAEGTPGDLERRPWTYLALVLGLVALVAARVRLGRMLGDEADLAQQRSQVSIASTLRALLITALMAAPTGAILYALAWLTRTWEGGHVMVGDSSGATRMFALSQGLASAAVVAWVVGAFRALTLPRGLAAAHFDWPDVATRRVRIQTAWLLPTSCVAAFLAEFLSNLEVGAGGGEGEGSFSFEVDGLAHSEGFSRLAFVVLLASFALFHLRTLHPSRGILALNARAALPNDVLTNLRRLWFFLGLTLLAALGVAALLGYGFTARALFNRLLLTVSYIVGVFVLRAVALRWTRLVRRREALDRLRKRREEQRAKRLAEIERLRDAGEEVEDVELSALQVEDEQVDVAALSTDVLSLVRVLTGLAALIGVFLIWAAVLPALGALDDVRLWERDQLVAAIDGTHDGLTGIAKEWVSLADLGLALLVLAMTWMAVRDLPSFLEIALLSRLQLGSGERYAITTLFRYALTLVGLLWAFNELGLSWSKVQWLAAGVSVGLGFGMQEIFANFVSGIVLLFERPVRVGDWVTLGDVEGVVSRIRIRATTIRDRDLKELVVPNREFITGSFINWTLSDPVSRVAVTVGVAYGSDIERALQILLDCGRSSPYSVAEPVPNVIFKEFGASSLDLELRIFVHGREVKPRVVHDLHVRIDAAFRAAGIEIAFPQRDIHVRSVEGWPTAADTTPAPA